MRTVRDLHREAMALAQEASLYRKRGEFDTARKLELQAVPLEVQAASQVEKLTESEPTRSILYQSAASLAFQAGDYATAQRLVFEGLSGYPPPRVEQELKHLFDQINFESHLAVNEEKLTAAEMQLSIAGDMVGYGRVAYSAFEDRMRATITLIERTVRRLTGEPYRPNVRENWATRSFTTLISAPRPGSFSITIELVQKDDGQHTLLTTGEQVIDDVVEGVQQIQENRLDELKARINDNSYYVSFVSVAQQLAPDGDKVKVVGLTTPKREVAFTQPQSSVIVPASSEMLRPIEVTDQVFSNTVRGILDAATASRGKITLVMENGKKMSLWVQEGMDDAVRTYFNRLVEVRVQRTNGRNELEGITGADE